MVTLKDILLSHIQAKKLKQSYLDNLRHTKKSGSIDWHKRAVESAKSLIAAVCFKETSVSLVEKTDNLIYPPIGFYYSIFHLSLSLLKLDYSTDLDELKGMHHRDLEKKVRSKLISTRILTDNYVNHMVKLKKLRESCNYRFGSTEYWLTEELKTADDLTDSCFNEGLSFVHIVLQETDMLFHFQASIGDNFGDDIIDNYLSGEERERVWNYLVVNSLTT